MRTGDRFPLPQTKPTKYYLDAKSGALGLNAPAQQSEASYEAMGPGVHFSTTSFTEDTEFTGFIHAKLWVSSSTTDMDIFATLRAFDESGKEVIINGAHEMTSVTKGWLRVSQRKIDPARSNEWRPFHAHDEVQKLTPGETYEIDVEIWPTSFVFPKGYRMVLSIMGKDFEFDGIPGRILHNHPQDRSGNEFSGTNRVLTGGQTASHLTMPLIPADR
jgi:predicted acyl esterase